MSGPLLLILFKEIKIKEGGVHPIEGFPNATRKRPERSSLAQQQHVDRLHRHTIHPTYAGMAHANGPTARGNQQLSQLVVGIGATSGGAQLLPPGQQQQLLQGQHPSPGQQEDDDISVQRMSAMTWPSLKPLLRIVLQQTSEARTTTLLLLCIVPMTTANAAARMLFCGPRGCRRMRRCAR